MISASEAVLSTAMVSGLKQAKSMSICARNAMKGVIEMALVFNKAKVNRQYLSKVRRFLKQYKTRDYNWFLSVVFTKDWKHLKGSKWYAFDKRCMGFYYPIPAEDDSDWVNGFGGVAPVVFPAIVVNCNHEGWLKTFLHEFCHYLQDVDGRLSKRGREKEANEFANQHIAQLEA